MDIRRFMASELEEAFKRNFTPCDDFYNHVCDINNPAIEKFSRYMEPYAIKEIARHQPAADDVVMTRVLKAMEEIRNSSTEVIPALKSCRWRKLKTFFDPDKSGDYADGRMVGELAAYGRADPFFMKCRSKYSCAFIGEKSGKTRKEFYSTLKDYPKGVFDGYFDALNITVENDFLVEHTVHLAGYLVDVMTDEEQFEKQVKRVSEKLSDDMDIGDRHLVLSDIELLNPYLNVLYALTMYTNPDFFHTDMMEEFERFVTKIVDEICEAVESSDWMGAKSRSRLVRHIRRLKIEIGIPKYHRNLERLTELLENYRKAVDALPFDEDDGICDLEKIVRAVQATSNRLNYLRKENGSIDVISWTAKQMKSDLNMFTSKNGLYYKGRIAIWPATFHPLYGNYSLGFKYAYAGSVIAHEIFHSLGLDETIKPHLSRIADTEHYREAQECYYDYFGRVTCVDNGKECPSGSAKASEGYCDVEGLRVVYRIFMKAINQSNYGNRAKRDSGFDEFPLFGSKPILNSRNENLECLLKDQTAELPEMDLNEEVKWFFYGFQLSWCSNTTGSKLPTSLFHSDHPRNSIRVHAVVKQMKEFSDAFQCQKGDKNYVVDAVCEAYPLLETQNAEEATSSPAPLFTEKPMAYVQPNGSWAVLVGHLIMHCLIAIVCFLWM